MPVNFLPFPDVTSRHDVDVSSLLSSTDPSERPGVTTDVSAASVEFRTRMWVSTIPSEISSRSDLGESTQPEVAEADQCSEVSPVSPASITELETHCGELAHSSPAVPSIDAAPTLTGSLTDSVRNLTVADKSLDSISFTETNCLTDATLHDSVATAGREGVRSNLRSRAGRLLKPVSRLIEIMQQKTVVGDLKLSHMQCEE